MSLAINTNVQSLFAQRSLSKNTSNLNKSVEKLSTGYRINRAADDAAGLAISQKMTAEIRGIAKAKQNSLDGISMIQTAEGGLGVVQDNLQRIRELMVQGGNGTNGEDELAAIQREINERVNTIDDVASATSFNGTDLLQGGANTTLVTGADGATSAVDFTQTEVDITSVAAGSIGENSVALNTLGVGSTSVATVAGGNAATTIADVDAMIDNVSRMRSGLGASQNSLESKIDYLDVASENISASRSRIRDVDVASESASLTKSQILQQTAAAMLGQANSAPQVALNLLP